jgi:pimeloyl-ACP methyl ester carboxylesterase
MRSRTVIATMLLALSLPFATALAAELPIDPTFVGTGPLSGFARATLRNSDNDRLDVYLRRDGKRKPVLVFLPGSGCFPTILKIKAGDRMALGLTSPVLADDRQNALGVHVAMLERRGIQSLADIIAQEDATPEKLLSRHPCSARNGDVTLEDRVDDSLRQLHAIVAQPWAGPLLLAGTSEGADVVAAIVARAPQLPVSAMLLIGGAGPSQFFDLVSLQRDAQSREGVARVFADYLSFLDEDPPADYLGYPSRRWKSFAIDATPLDNLLKTQIPVFIAHGELDKSVPIASADLLAVELMRQQKRRAICYWAVAGADHGLSDARGNHLPGIIETFVTWANDAPTGRTILTRAP